MDALNSIKPGDILKSARYASPPPLLTRIADGVLIVR
jgi:hypothetical protein